MPTISATCEGDTGYDGKENIGDIHTAFTQTSPMVSGPETWVFGGACPRDHIAQTATATKVAGSGSCGEVKWARSGTATTPAKYTGNNFDITADSSADGWTFCGAFLEITKAQCKINITERAKCTK